MNYGDYIRLVKERSGIKSDDAAKRAIESVLEALGQKISIGQAEDMAAVLPPRLKPYLMLTPAAEPFNLSQFLLKVSQREGVDIMTAEEHARAVLSTLADWIPRPELRDTLEQLPSNMRNLFLWEKRAA